MAKVTGYMVCTQQIGEKKFEPRILVQEKKICKR